jgi:hypothetical protein
MLLFGYNLPYRIYRMIYSLAFLPPQPVYKSQVSLKFIQLGSALTDLSRYNKFYKGTTLRGNILPVDR